jgi:hypothetical protein
LRRSVGGAAQEWQFDLLGIERFSRSFLACARQKIVLSSHVGADHLLIVEGERERVEDLGWAKLRIALQDALDTSAAAIEGPKAANRYPRAKHVGATPEHVGVGSDVRVRH